MQFKIDENVHSDVADLLRQQGHDALTVYDQGLQGGCDANIAAVAVKSNGRSSRWISTFETSGIIRQKASTGLSCCD